MLFIRRDYSAHTGLIPSFKGSVAPLAAFVRMFVGNNVTLGQALPFIHMLSCICRDFVSFLQSIM